MKHNYLPYRFGRRDGFAPPWATTHDSDAEHDNMHAFGPFGGPGYGPPKGFGPPFGFGPGRPGGRRGGRPRGDIRTAVLVLLDEQPRHGYDLIRAIEERTAGTWTPSAGSIYPQLQALEDEGMLRIEDVDGRKTASLTAEGHAWVESHREQADAVFARPDGADEALALRDEIAALAEATMHVVHHSGPTSETAERAAKILATARKDLYGLLSHDED